MKNINKFKFVSLFLVFLYLIMICGCTHSFENTSTISKYTSSVDEEYEALKKAYKANRDKYVVFSKTSGSQEHYVLVEDIIKYESKYPEINGTWFRDKLSGEDLIIYNSCLYALENHYIWLSLYVEDSDKDFKYIREAFSLDTPLLEQNYNDLGESIHKWPNNYIGESISFQFEQFAETRWQKKMMAVEKCRRIVADIPSEYTTQLQKMEYLYKYVCDHIEYVEYENMDDNDYLYDAVCVGKTVCDGYSNMLNLLFNLIGVESFEVVGSDIKDYKTATPEELKNSSAHTWVVAKIDDEFYNFDPTFEDGFSKDYPEYAMMYFGFSDNLTSYKYFECEDLRPKCTDTSRDFGFADVVVHDVKVESLQKIANITMSKMKSGNFITCVGINQALTEETFKKFLDDYADKLTGIKEIKTRRYHFNNATLVEITATPR